MRNSEALGTTDVRKLIFSLGWPAALNFSVVTLYNLTDIFFIGKWLGSVQIAAVVIVGLAIFLFSSFGLAIGIGGGTLITSALGVGDKERASRVLGNQNILVFAFSVLIVASGWVFRKPVLELFGAGGDIFHHASAYYKILLFGVPFLSWVMMGNSVIHSMGRAKVAMLNSVIPTVVNLILTPLFIRGFGMGIEGAAWATAIGYVLGSLLVLRFFAYNRSEVKLSYPFTQVNTKLMGEMSGIGGSVLTNVITTNLFIIALNHALFNYEQELGVVIYGIINRISMLFLVLIVGIEGGIRPIISYNFGRQDVTRIKDTVNSAMKYGLVIGYIVSGMIFLSADPLVRLFTDDSQVIVKTPFAMKVIFSFIPFSVIQAIATAYYQAVSNSKMAFCLVLLRNIILFIPLLYGLAYSFGYQGILYVFPVVDILTAMFAAWLLRNELSLKRLSPSG